MRSTSLTVFACALLLFPASLEVAQAELVASSAAGGRIADPPSAGTFRFPGSDLPTPGLPPVKVKVTTDPQTARIYVNGLETGTGKTNVAIPGGSCVTVEVRLEGYVEQTFTWCNQPGTGGAIPPKNQYVKLVQDATYTSSVQSDIANTDIVLTAKKGRTQEEAWKSVLQTVLGKFDALENNDEKAGYLRTAWVGVVFAASNNTVRSRVVVKQISDDPITYKFKFVSEQSGAAGTPFGADELYKPFPRILKQYDGMIEELTAKLSN
jgi:hypothetical protein